MTTSTKTLLFLTIHFVTILPCQSQIDIQKIDDLVGSHMAENNIPGMVVGIVKDKELIFSKGYGFSDVEAEKEMDPDMIMNVGSISKTITSTAIMQLWEQGKLELDADINNYLPISIQNPNHPDEMITIQQLLTHTSSIIDGPAYQESYQCGDPTISLKVWITEYLVGGGKFYNPEANFLDKKPGEKHQYSNVGFGLLGYIVEEVSKQPFKQYCRENIFEPLGMQQTGWFIQSIDETNHITPHIFVNNDNRQMIINHFSDFFPNETEFILGTNIGLCLYSFPNYPDGLVRTNIEELSYFLRTFMNEGIFNGQRILKRSTVEKILSPQDKSDHNQGLCWSRSNFESLWGHNGSDPGIATKMQFSKDTGIGIIIFQNNNEGDQFGLLKEIYQTTTEGLK